MHRDDVAIMEMVRFVDAAYGGKVHGRDVALLAAQLLPGILQGPVDESGASVVGGGKRKLDQDHAEIWSALGHAYAVSGNQAEAQKVLDRLQDPKALSYVAPYNVAIVYAGLGNRDQTFAWLDRAYKQRSYYLPVYLTTPRSRHQCGRAVLFRYSLHTTWGVR